MKIISAEFVTSSASGEGIPRDGLAQVAMAGRSNVGKSTLINALVRTKIARTSAAPGKTRLANVYRVTADGGPGGPGRWSVYLIDLPGYGYARGGSDAAQELSLVADGYFASTAERLPPERGAGGKPAAGRPPSESERGWAASAEATASSAEASPRRGPASSERRGTLLLVDSRHPGLPADAQAHRWLSTVGPAPLIVATKVDKLSRAERTRNLRELERVFGTPALPMSATGGEGLDALWKVIASLARRSGRETTTER